MGCGGWGGDGAGVGFGPGLSPNGKTGSCGGERTEMEDCEFFKTMVNTHLVCNRWTLLVAIMLRLSLRQQQY